jgi:hypothetical protein
MTCLPIAVPVNGVPSKVFVKAIWEGQNLFVHKTYFVDPPKRNREYTITHKKTGLVCLKSRRGQKLNDIIAFAGRWDSYFDFETDNVTDWPFRQFYKNEKRLFECDAIFPGGRIR